MTHVTFWGWVGPAKNPDVYFSWVSWGVKRYNSIKLSRKDKEEEGFQPQELSRWLCARALLNNFD